MTIKEAFIHRMITRTVCTDRTFKLYYKEFIREQKVTKNKHSEELINDLVNKKWSQFLKDIKDSEIGITKAIDILFKG